MGTDARAATTLDVGRLLDEGRWTPHQRVVVLLAALAIVFDGLDNQLLGVAVPAMMREWNGQPRGAFAPILACGMVGMMIGGAVAGMVGDRLGRRVALIGSVLMFALPTVAIAAADTLVALGVLRFLAGLGLGGALPNAAALASEYVPRRHRPLAVTLTIVCVPLGGTLGALLGGQVLPALGWRVLFGLGGALPVVRRARADALPARIAALPGQAARPLARAARACCAAPATSSRPCGVRRRQRSRGVARVRWPRCSAGAAPGFRGALGRVFLLPPRGLSRLQLDSRR